MSVGDREGPGLGAGGILTVKKWGLAPMTGSLAPPPPYGSEQGSILLESGRESPGLGAGGILTLEPEAA
jgi:hypothetical protein